MDNTLLIHNDNVKYENFTNSIKFSLINSDVDKSISNYIIIDEKLKDTDIVFIKDNLSSNYIELLGLRVAYHLRLSGELKTKRFIPIVILSDLDYFELNKLSSFSNILFTKNIYLIPNTKKAIEKILRKNFKNLTEDEYEKNFLNLINVQAPKDYLSHHSIANEWAIYKWSKILNVKSNKIRINYKKISAMLYFKYLQIKYDINNKNDNLIMPKNKGKVLLIDDEWNKGWKDILSSILKDNIEFETFKYNFKDTSNLNLITQLNYEGLEKQIKNVDIVILDLRLVEQDHNENTKIDEYSGIKILKKIHEINAGIQVIMLTATTKSIILEKLYAYNILGYIKKEHPNDNSITTIENINKFVNLIDVGLEQSYLKKIFSIQTNILNILENNPFKKYISDSSIYENYLQLIEKNTRYIFDILDSDIDSKFNYAMISIMISLEAIVKIFLFQKSRDDYLIFWDNEEAKGIYEHSRLEDKLLKILNYKMSSKAKIDLEELIRHRNNYVHSNKKYKEVNHFHIKKWYGTLEQIILIIKNSEYSKYIPKEIKPLSEKKTVITKSGLRKKV